MKIRTGKYYHQFGLGVSFIYYAKGMWSIIIDFGLWYIEVSMEKENIDKFNTIFHGSIVCDRCGSPEGVGAKFPEGEMWEYELVCDECLRYEEYMNSLTNVKPEVDKKKRKVKSKADKSNEEPSADI